MRSPFWLVKISLPSRTTAAVIVRADNVAEAERAGRDLIETSDRITGSIRRLNVRAAPIAHVSDQVFFLEKER